MLSEVRPRRKKTKGPGPLGEPVKWFGLTQGLPRGSFDCGLHMPKAIEWTMEQIADARGTYIYCPLTGEFRYARTSFRGGSSRSADTAIRARRGDIAGSAPLPEMRGRQYSRLYINGNTPVFAHRLAYMLHNGPIAPGQFIDHINGNTADNRLCNLRAVSARGNQENRTHPQRNGGSGYMGVSYDKKRRKYQSKIKSRGVYINIGRYDTAEEAYSAYVQMKRQLHTEGNMI